MGTKITYFSQGRFDVNTGNIDFTDTTCVTTDYVACSYEHTALDISIKLVDNSKKVKVYLTVFESTTSSNKYTFSAVTLSNLNPQISYDISSYSYMSYFVLNIEAVEGTITTDDISFVEYDNSIPWRQNTFTLYPTNRYFKTVTRPLNELDLNDIPNGIWRIDTNTNHNYPYLKYFNWFWIKQPQQYKGKNVYIIYADDQYIYGTNFPDQDFQLIDPKLTMEKNCAGSLEFTMPPNHVMYNKLDKYKSTIRIYKNYILYWEGRQLTEETDFYNQKKVYVEGCLSYLNDTCQPQVDYSHRTAYQIADAVLKIHNSKVKENRIFYIGYVPAEFPTEDEIYSTSYTSTLEVLSNLADCLDGYLSVTFDQGNRVLNIYKNTDARSTANQKIIFGENLIDFTRSYDFSDLVTVLLPLGKVKETSQESIGAEIIPGGTQYNYTVTAGYAMIYDNDAITMVSTSSNYVVGKIYVNGGDRYYYSARLPQGTNACWYVMYYSDGRVYSYEAVGSGIGYSDQTQVEINVPEGVDYICFTADTEYVPLTLYSSVEVRDGVEQYTTVAEVNNGSLYVKATPRNYTYYDEHGIAHTETIDPLEKYGYVEKTLTLDDIEDPQTLLEQAQAYLNNYQFDKMELEINAVDMVNLGIDTTTLEINQDVRVISPPHGVDRLFPIDKIEIDLSNPANTTYSLNSETSQGLTEIGAEANSDIYNTLSAIPQTGTVLNAAKQSALALLRQGTTGVVSLNVDPTTGHCNSITISSEADWQQSQNYWIWNINGLGYVRNGNDVGVALTSDGHIVADFITAGTMFANRIKGGTLTLGAYGDGSDDGLIIVRKADGTYTFRADKEGAEVNGRFRTTTNNTYVKIENGYMLMGLMNNGEEQTYNTRLWGNSFIYDQVQYSGLLLETNTINIDTANTAAMGVNNKQGPFILNGYPGQTASYTFAHNIEPQYETIRYVSGMNGTDPVYSEKQVMVGLGNNFTEYNLYFKQGLMVTEPGNDAQWSEEKSKERQD